MYRRSTEVIVGIFAIVGIACLVYLSVNLGGVSLFGDNTYRVSAVFSSITGLKKGASVEIAGVPVGKVLDIELSGYDARVEMNIRKEVKLSDDTIASIRTKGIIGDMFVKLTPGASSELVEPGGELIDTESAISLEELISKYIFESNE